MTVEVIISLIVSTIISVTVSTIVGFIIKRFLTNYDKKQEEKQTKRKEERIEEIKDIVTEVVSPVVKDLKSLKEGSQALLRSKLYNIYDDCTEKGFATIDEKNNFENIYSNYHSLGKNGVMDSIRDEFLKLPSSKPVTKTNTKKKLNESK